MGNKEFFLKKKAVKIPKVENDVKDKDVKMDEVMKAAEKIYDMKYPNNDL